MRQWAIVIGLNEYQSFQPLSCAQKDAEALHQLLIREAGLPAEQCLLLTNSSPYLWGKPTLPTRVNLQSWIELLAQNCIQPGDSLWFFFSGNGLCYRGEDYLVPADGDPDAIETTCLSLASIYARLSPGLAAGTSVMLLDINRNQSALFNESVGINGAQLAHQFALPTIFSCQPGQFSREISGLGHGLFTATLIEGLRYQQGATLATLIHFLRDRLPELSEHYWQPTQQPLAICPADKLHHPLLSMVALESAQNGLNTSYTPTSMSAASSTAVLSAPAVTPPTTGFTPVPASSMEDRVADRSGQQPIIPAASPEFRTPLAVVNQNWEQNGNQFQISKEAEHLDSSASTRTGESIKATNERLWHPMLLWGSLVSLVLMGCVLWRNWSLLGTPIATTDQPPPVTNPAADSSPAAPPGSVAPPTVAPTAGPEALQQAPTSLGVSGSSTTPMPPSQSPNQPPNQSAERILNFNPVIPPQNVSGRAILANAREMVKVDQATPYRDAIDEARKISSEDAVYQDAQQDIADWSQTIYTIAQRRASQKQWDTAILAADLVPSDDKKLHPQAQAAIAQWCPALATLPNTTAGLPKAKAICSIKKPI